MTGNSKDARWLLLIEVSEILRKEAGKFTPQGNARLLAQADMRLSHVLTTFGKEIDPVFDLEGFAVRQICRSFLSIIDSLHNALLFSNGRSGVTGGQVMIKALKVPKAIYITEKDLIRLERVLELAGPSSESEMLEEELLRATVVPSGEVPPDVVTMNSRVRFKDLTSDEESELTLCYPKDADLERGKISVLAPVGAALLGLKSGDEIEWPLPSGKTRVLKITDVVFQPEAAGQLHL